MLDVGKRNQIVKIVIRENRSQILEGKVRIPQIKAGLIERKHVGWFMNYYSSSQIATLLLHFLLITLLISALILIQIKMQNKSN